MEHIFYKDKGTLFEFKINVEGVDIDSTFARVILENNDRKYLFEGKIKDGICSVDLPALKDLKETKKSKLKVEVIADTSYFVPYESDYELKESKKVVVEMVSKKSESVKPKVIIEAIEKVEVKENKFDSKRKEFVSLFEKYKHEFNTKPTVSSSQAKILSSFFVKKEYLKENDAPVFRKYIDRFSTKEIYSIKKAIGFGKKNDNI